MLLPIFHFSLLTFCFRWQNKKKIKIKRWSLPVNPNHPGTNTQTKPQISKSKPTLIYQRPRFLIEQTKKVTKPELKKNNNNKRIEIKSWANNSQKPRICGEHGTPYCHSTHIHWFTTPTTRNTSRNEFELRSHQSSNTSNASFH